MCSTYVSKVKQQLEEIGYSFFKCDNNYWHLMEDGVSLDSGRRLGELLMNIAKQFGIE